MLQTVKWWVKQKIDFCQNVRCQILLILIPLLEHEECKIVHVRYLDILTNAAHQIRHLCQTICCLQQLSLVLLCMKCIHCTIYNLNKTKIKERWILIFFIGTMQCNVLIFFVKEGAITRFFFISQTHDLLFLEKVKVSWFSNHQNISLCSQKYWIQMHWWLKSNEKPWIYILRIFLTNFQATQGLLNILPSLLT